MVWKDSNGELKEGRTMKKTAIFGLALASPLAGTAVPKAAVNAGSCVDPGGRQLSRPLS